MVDGDRVTGASPVVLDALDRDAIRDAVIEAEPEVVVHELTALAGFTHFRKLDEGFAETNRLRTEGTDHLLEGVRRRRFPIVGGGTGVWSFIHIDDAAAATLAAIEAGRPGVYNIVDDEPAPVAEWLPVLAGAIGAKSPGGCRPGWAVSSSGNKGWS